MSFISKKIKEATRTGRLCILHFKGTGSRNSDKKHFDEMNLFRSKQNFRMSICCSFHFLRG